MRSMTILLMLAIFGICVPAVQSQVFFWSQLYGTAQEQMKKSEWAVAKRTLLQAMPYAQDLGQTDPRYGLTLGALGQVYEHDSEFDRAEPMLNRAEDVLGSSNYKGEELVDIVFAHQDMFIKMGRKEEAVALNERFKEIFQGIPKKPNSEPSAPVPKAHPRTAQYVPSGRVNGSRSPFGRTECGVRRID